MLKAQSLARKKLDELAKKEDILLAVVYGSFAVGRKRKTAILILPFCVKEEAILAIIFTNMAGWSVILKKFSPAEELIWCPCAGSIRFSFIRL